MISIILPTYNERENIVDLILEISKVVKDKKEIIVVDDNSPDGTSKVVKGLIKKNVIPNLRLETRMSGPCLTKSIWRGIGLAKGGIVVWMDCDFSMPPAKIPELLDKIKQGYDVAVGSRFIKGGGFKKNLSGTPDSWLAVILSRLMNYAIQLLLNHRFKDYTSGFIAIKKEVVEKIKLRGDYGEYFMDLMTRAILLGYKFVEVPYVCLPRQRGVSKTGSNLIQLSKRGIRYLWMAFKLMGLRIKFLSGVRI